MPTAFVTGVTGQDGGYLVERLRADSVRVHVLVRGTGAQARMRETYPATRSTSATCGIAGPSPA